MKNFATVDDGDDDDDGDDVDDVMVLHSKELSNCRPCVPNCLEVTDVMPSCSGNVCVFNVCNGQSEDARGTLNIERQTPSSF